MGRELNFETGLVEFDVNGACKVTFNPTDNYFVERVFNTFYDLDKKQEAYRERVEKMADKREVFAFARERDIEMRAAIDAVFETPVSDALFGSMSVYAVANGLPVWCNLMLAVIDELDTTMAREKKLTDPRIRKYTEKYHK